MNWMDMIIIMIIIINAFSGLNRGFVLSLFSIGSYIIAFIAAKLYYPYIAGFFLNNTNLIPKIQSYVFNKINNSESNMVSSQGAGNENIFEIMNFPKPMEDMLMKSAAVSSYSEGIMGNIHGYIAEIITKVVVDLLSIIIIFLVVKLILNIIGALLNEVANLPVIKQFNSLGGFIFGFVRGILIVFLIASLMVIPVSISNGGFIAEGLKGSMLAVYFYDYNFIFSMIDQIVAII